MFSIFGSQISDYLIKKQTGHVNDANSLFKKGKHTENEQIQDTIQKLGYDFNILNGLIDQNGLEK